MIIRAVLIVLALAASSGALAQSPERPPERPSVFDIAASTTAPRTGAGLGVDATGGPVIDPTANVVALQAAATQRQDDLREASERFILARIEASEHLEELREMHAKALRESESRRLDEVIALRANYEERLQAAEAKRIDAIRTVDVNAVAVANQRAVEQAAVLDQNVTQSADNVRNLVADTAAAVAAAQEASNNALSAKIDQSFNALQSRVAALEQAQYLGQGRQTVSDPALQALVDEVKVIKTTQSSGDPAVAALAEEIKALRLAESTRIGEVTGSSNTVLWIISGLGVILTLITIASTLTVIFTRRQVHPAVIGKQSAARA